MRECLDGLDAGDPPVPREERVPAAPGPKRLDLAAERALGAHTSFVKSEHRRGARERVGPDALVAPEPAVVVETDPGTARATARSYAAGYLRRPKHTSDRLRLGFAEPMT